MDSQGNCRRIHLEGGKAIRSRDDRPQIRGRPIQPRGRGHGGGAKVRRLVREADFVKAFKKPHYDGLEAHPRDTTPAGLAEAHLAEYGKTPIDYKKAFELTIPAVIHQEGGEAPRAIVKQEMHNFSTPPPSSLAAKLDKKMRKLVDEGSFELLPVGESNPLGDDPKENWIFSVIVDTGGDHGFWASVDRETGEVSVGGFN